MIPARPVDQDFDLEFDGGVDESMHTYGVGTRLAITNGEYAAEGGITKRHGFTSAIDFETDEYPRAILPLPGGGVGYAFKKQFRAELPGDTLTSPRSNFHANLRSIAAIHGIYEPEVPPTSSTYGIDVTMTAVDGAVTTIGSTPYAITLALGEVGSLGAGEGRSNQWVVTNGNTGQVVLSGYVSDTGATSHRVIALGAAKFVIVYRTSTATAGVYGIVIDLVLKTVGTPTLIDANTYSTSIDAIGGDGSTYGYVSGVVGGNMRALKFDTSLTLVGSVSSALPAGTGTRTSIAVDSSGNGHVAIVGATGNYVVMRTAADFNSVTGTSTPSGQPTRTHNRVGICAASGAGVFVVAYTSSATNRYVELHTAWLSNDHVTVTADRTLHDLVLLSKPFIDYNTTSSTNRDESRDIVYAAVLGRPDTLAAKYKSGAAAGSGVLSASWQTPVFVGRFTPGHDEADTALDNPYIEPIAILITDGSLTSESSPHIPNVTSIIGKDGKDDPTTDWYIPFMELFQQLKATNPTTATKTYRGRMVRLEHAMNDPLPAVPTDLATYQGGSLLRAHNGQVWGEGPIIFNPPPPEIQETANTGILPAGTYTFYSVWNFDDGQGRRWRSAPSAAVTFVKASAAASSRLEVTLEAHIPTMRAPRDGTLGTWTLEVYRTADAGTTPQLEVIRVIDVDTDSFTITGGTGAWVSTDAQLADHAVLYTVAEQETSPAPPASAMCVHDERLFVVDALDRRRVWYSKPFTEGYGPEFSPAFSFRFDSAEIVALASMDGNLLAFTTDAVYASSDEGYTKSVTGTNYTLRVVSQGAGASNPYCVTVIPAGALYHSNSGVHLLGRDLQVNDISAQTLTTLATPPQQFYHVPPLKRVYVVLGGERDASDLSNRMLVLDYARNKTRWLYHDHESYAGLCTVTAIGYSGGYVKFVLSRNSSANVHTAFRDTTTYSDVDATSTERNVSVEVALYGWAPEGLSREVRVRRIQLTATVETDNNSLNLQLLPAPVDGIESLLGYETHTWSGAVVGTPAAATLWRPFVKPKHDRVSRYAQVLITVAPTSSPDERGPILHGITITYTPTGRVAQPGAAFGPTS